MKRYFFISGVPHESKHGPWVKFADLPSDLVKTCGWMYDSDDFKWRTECDHALLCEVPLPDGFRTCPFCQGIIVEKAFIPLDDCDAEMVNARMRAS